MRGDRGPRWEDGEEILGPELSAGEPGGRGGHDGDAELARARRHQLLRARRCPTGRRARWSTPGCAWRKAPTIGATGSMASVGSAARSSRPAASPRPLRPRPGRSPGRAAPAGPGPTSASPAAVSTTRRPTRWNSGVPSSVSSSRTACETDGWDTCSASAARVMPPPSTTARNRRSRRRSIGIAYGVQQTYVLDFWKDRADDGTMSLVGVVLAGVGIGFAFGLFGAGGSAFGTPILALMGVPAPIAVASPLPAVLPSALMSAREYLRAGVLDRRVAALAVLAGAPMALVGAHGLPRGQRAVPPGRVGRAAPRSGRPDGRARPCGGGRAVRGTARPDRHGGRPRRGGRIRGRVAGDRRWDRARADLRHAARVHDGPRRRDLARGRRRAHRPDRHGPLAARQHRLGDRRRVRARYGPRLVGRGADRTHGCPITSPGRRSARCCSGSRSSSSPVSSADRA